MQLNGADVSYILGSIVSCTAIAYTGQKVIAALKARWISEADKQRTQRDNTEAVMKLNNSLGELTTLLNDHIRDPLAHDR